MDAHTLDLTLPPEAGSIAEARTRLCEAIAPEFGEYEVERLRLLVSEVVTNAVRHGDGTEPLELHATWNDEVRIEVSDHGGGFTPTPRLGALDEPADEVEAEAARLVDRWGVETDAGTTVWFVLRRH